MVQISRLVILCSILLGTPFVEAQEGNSRQIVLEEFTHARPAAKSPQTQSSKVRQSPQGSKLGTAKANAARYRRVTRPLAAAPNKNRLPAAELGITLWRLRPSRNEDEEGTRMLVMEDAKQTHWTPERIEAETSLKVGERVRLSVEAPRRGYLYVIDREQYADGSLGDAFLIFPTKRTRDGDNAVRPGKLIDIPAQEDDPNYFTLVPSPSRNDQVGEVLTLLLVPQPLPLTIGDKPLMVSATQVSEWQKLWGSAYERFEMEGGAGLAWTTREREAARAKSTRYLTQAELPPQTIYRLAAAGHASLLVTVQLNYRNK